MHADMDADGTLVLTLKNAEEKRLLRGHPWVFSNELQSAPKNVEPGAQAVLKTAKGRIVGAGYFNPNSLISLRLLSRTPQKFDAGFFRERLERAHEFRERRLNGERSYRLCYGESDALPGLVVDKYEDVLVLQILAAGMERLLAQIEEALTGLLAPKGIYLKNDHPLRKLEGLTLDDRLLCGDVPDKMLIEEAGLRYAVAPKSGQKTGFYFDQRDNRAALVPYFRGRSVLDLHCFSGAFSLNAAKHGAAKVYGLDSSAEAVALAEENASLNGYSARCGFDAGDAEEILRAFSSTRQSFAPDMILLDPPSFARSKKHIPKALRAYSRLNALALKALPAGGLLASSTCSHHVTREAFIVMLRAAAAKAGRTVRLLQLRGQAIDHPVLLSMPESDYLHFALLEVV